MCGQHLSGRYPYCNDSAAISPPPALRRALRFQIADLPAHLGTFLRLVTRRTAGGARQQNAGSARKPKQESLKAKTRLAETEKSTRTPRRKGCRVLKARRQGWSLGKRKGTRRAKAEGARSPHHHRHRRLVCLQRGRRHRRMTKKVSQRAVSDMVWSLIVETISTCVQVCYCMQANTTSKR